KIVKRATGGQIVAGLGGGMHDHVRPDLFQAAQHRRPVSYIEFVMSKSLVIFDQPLLVPACIALRTEKVHAHIVVGAMDPPAQAAEMRDYFRPDQSRAAADKKLLHFVAIFHTSALVAASNLLTAWCTQVAERVRCSCNRIG